MEARETTWGLILAAGEGDFLRSVIADVYGADVPAQYCAFNGDQPLVRTAVRRAGRFTVRNRVVAVVADGHRPWWTAQLDDLPAENIIVQPCSRGSACSVLLPLIHVLLIDPQAVVVVLPSDHFVADEAAITRSIRRALRVVTRSPESIVLLGIPPDAPDPELEWIEPTLRSVGGVHWILSFVERPIPALAEQLTERGALWNSSIIVAKGITLLGAFNRAFPELVKRFGAAWLHPDGDHGEGRLTTLFAGLPNLDLSRDVLASSRDSLRVLPVPPCGWSDLGTPERVLRCLERIDARPTLRRPSADDAEELPDLATGVLTFVRRSRAADGHPTRQPAGRHVPSRA